MDMEEALNEFQKGNSLLISNIIDTDMYESLGTLLTE
jgi:hypothetical protein